MALTVSIVLQAVQLLLVVAIGPLLLGIVRKTRARLLRRNGLPLLQGYREIWKLLHKETVLAHDASWVFRGAPYVALGLIWVAAALTPTFATGLLLTPSADLITIVALLGAARFTVALASLDSGTAFGAMGASRTMTIGSFAEPAMLLIAFVVALIAGTTDLSAIAALFSQAGVELRVSLALALFAFLCVAAADNGRIPMDDPDTHRELTMVHQAMTLEYSGPHLALIELAASTKLVLYGSLLICLFVPFGIATNGAGVALVAGVLLYLVKLGVLAVLLALAESCLATLRVFRYPTFLGGAFAAAAVATFLLFVSRGF